MVRFYCQNTDFSFKFKAFTKKWLKNVAQIEQKSIGDISIIFCSDEYLLNINKQFLGHDYYTDIITFDYCVGNILSGDLFISIESVKDNSVYFNTSFEDELNRVIVHGVLHLIGFDDHTDKDIAEMRAKENEYLKCREVMISSL